METIFVSVVANEIELLSERSEHRFEEGFL